MVRAWHNKNNPRPKRTRAARTENTLASLGNQKLIEQLSALQSPDQQNRIVAAFKLCYLEPGNTQTRRSVLTVLIKALKDPSEKVRLHAANAMVVWGQNSKTARYALLEAIKREPENTHLKQCLNKIH